MIDRTKTNSMADTADLIVWILIALFPMRISVDFVSFYIDETWKNVRFQKHISWFRANIPKSR